MQSKIRLVVALLLWGVVPLAIAQSASDESAYLEALYFQLHRDPELSFKEERTAARIADELSALGFEVMRHFGGTGVVAVLPNGEGRRYSCVPTWTRCRSKNAPAYPMPVLRLG